MTDSQSDAPVHGQDVVLMLADTPVEVPGYWNLKLDVPDRLTRLLEDGTVLQYTPLEVSAERAFEHERQILADGNYRISLSGDPGTIDFLGIMRAMLILSEGREPIEVVIAEDQEVIEREPEPGEAPRVVERRTHYRRLGRIDEPLPENLVVFDLSDEGGSDEDGRQLPVDIPGARVLGWRGLRNRERMVQEAYAEAAARSLAARAARLGAERPHEWAIYVGRRAQRAVAVLRTSRGFYEGRMIPILVRQQWRNDRPGEAPNWRPLGLQRLESTRLV